MQLPSTCQLFSEDDVGFGQEHGSLIQQMVPIRQVAGDKANRMKSIDLGVGKQLPADRDELAFQLRHKSAVAKPSSQPQVQPQFDRATSSYFV
jgi:hypothetical protein